MGMYDACELHVQFGQANMEQVFNSKHNLDMENWLSQTK